MKSMHQNKWLHNSFFSPLRHAFFFTDFIIFQIKVCVIMWLCVAILLYCALPLKCLFFFYRLKAMSANSESELRKAKAPHILLLLLLVMSEVSPSPITFDSRALQVFSILALFYICFYARAAPKGDCFHSFSSMSCSPPCTTEERAWIPTLIPTTTTRFLFIKKIRRKPDTDGGGGGEGASSSPAVLTHL